MAKEIDAAKLERVLGNSFRRAKGQDWKSADNFETTSFADWHNGFKADGEFIVIYFAAHWSPPCRLVSSILKSEFYDKVNAEKKVAEVIFCTDDQKKHLWERNLSIGVQIGDEDSFTHMPWWSMPFEPEAEDQKPLINNLKARFGITEMPIVVVCEARNLRLVTFYGRKDIKDGMDAVKRWRKERTERYPEDYPAAANEEEKKEDEKE